MEAESTYMLNGLYKVAFRGPAGQGGGVVVIRDGTFAGGDSALYYIGTMAETGADLKVRLEVHRHTDGMSSVFGVDDVNIELTGAITGDGAAFSVNGPAGSNFNANGTRIRNL